ncbi:hypothetical protein AB0N97_39730 [Streptomyces collinus]|uniref:hypothetical protein n=1 Tax=Streptomyces collinus TaxID=42684 RepID=UPI0034228CE1
MVQLEVPPAEADRAAARHNYMVSPHMTRTQRQPDAACPWQLIGFTSEDAQARGTLAWIIADAIVKSRSGPSPAYQLWRDAALKERKLEGLEARSVAAVVRSVFGLPPRGTDAKDHPPGYVGEWLWYLLTKEEQLKDHQLVLLEPPDWGVTGGGGDGFAAHRVPARAGTGSDTMLIFKLWELKKFTGTEGSVSSTISKAASQLAKRGDEYIAKVCWSNQNETGELGQLMAELAELWMRGDPRGGAGISVSTNTRSVPNQAFSQLAGRLPQLNQPDQLRGLMVAMDDFTAFAEQVKGYLWTAL